MFHVMLVLPILIIGIIFLALIAGALLFAVLAITAAVIGTTSVALLVKDKLIRKLLFSGFTIMFLTGCGCLLPGLVVFADLSSRVAFVCALVIGLFTAISSVMGIKNARILTSKAAKTILVVIFSIVLATAAGILGSVFILCRMWL